MAFTIKKVSANDVPRPGHRGRVRKPTDFDDAMVIYVESDWTDESGNVTWDGWNKVEVSTPDELKRAVKDLLSATNFKGVGAQKRIDTMGLALYFQVTERTPKPHTSKKEGNGHASSAEGTDSHSGTVHPIPEAVEASGGKRQRKAG